MNEWNRAVDQYMAMQTDFRSRFDIELAAKIGPHGGPLYKHCEAEDCDKVEPRDVEKMKCCAQCKLVRLPRQLLSSLEWYTDLLLQRRVPEEKLERWSQGRMQDSNASYPVVAFTMGYRAADGWYDWS